MRVSTSTETRPSNSHHTVTATGRTEEGGGRREAGGGTDRRLEERRVRSEE